MRSARRVTGSARCGKSRTRRRIDELDSFDVHSCYRIFSQETTRNSGCSIVISTRKVFSQNKFPWSCIDPPQDSAPPKYQCLWRPKYDRRTARGCCTAARLRYVARDFTEWRARFPNIQNQYDAQSAVMRRCPTKNHTATIIY